MSAHLALTFLISILGLEALYRWQVVDTYSAELRAFNPPEQFSNDGRPPILIMGDSFTAGRLTYPDLLRQAFPHVRIINAGVSGTGVIHTAVMAPKRFGSFHPSIFIYQIYVGNDLFDVTYPVNWREVSFGRNLYWMMANHLRVVGYLNYRMGQTLRADAEDDPTARMFGGTESPDVPGSFSPEKYEGRVRIYLKADPSLLDDSIFVKGRRLHDYLTLLGTLEKLVSYCEPTWCQAYLLVIPHVCQVDESYGSYMQQLGATFTEPARLRDTDYPFIAGLHDHFRRLPHVHVLNPIHALRTINSHTPVYFANDEHLNPLGQKTIADFLGAELHLH